MDFSNRLKGAVTQSVIQALLEGAGYRVMPLGIEEILRELKALSRKQYMDLELPEVLRQIPDFFISEEKFDQTWLLEVKYRRRWDENVRAELKETMKKQIANWDSVYVALILGERAKESQMPSANIGVVKLFDYGGELAARGEEEDWVFWDDLKWQQFSRLQDVFPALKNADQYEQGTLWQTLNVIDQLGGL